MCIVEAQAYLQVYHPLGLQYPSRPMFPAPAPAGVMRYLHCSTLHRFSVLEMVVVVAAAAAGGCIADLI